jgi:hypothetical protein
MAEEPEKRKEGRALELLRGEGFYGTRAEGITRQPEDKDRSEDVSYINSRANAFWHGEDD